MAIFGALIFCPPFVFIAEYAQKLQGYFTSSFFKI